MPSTILGRHYRYLLDKRGLAIAPSAHEERFALKLADGDITVDPHPRAVREALLIAQEIYGEGQGEHAELSALYALREDLEAPLPEPREIAWIPHAPNGPGLNPGKWVRLDAWIDDQFLLEDAIHLRYGRDAG